jgi:hypothetical protein
MGTEKKQIEILIKKYLSKREEILFAYIFGSFVEKENYHDIDIAVYLKENFDKNDSNKLPYGYESELISKLNSIVKKKIDFVVLNNARLTFQKKVIEKNILLFSKDENRRLDFENYTRKLYIDTSGLRRIKRYYLSAKIKNA